MPAFISKTCSVYKYAFISIAFGSLVLAACSKKSVSPSAVTGTTATTTTGSTTGVKPFLSGLVSMGSLAFHDADALPPFTLADISSRPGIFKGIVINATWSELEPAQGQLNTTFLDSCLLVIKNYNSSNPQTTIAAKLRIWPGPSAPDWAKQVGGSPVSFALTLSNGSTATRTTGRFWTTAYRTAWKSFLDRLGAKYDNEALIREICNTSGSTLTAEPFIIPADAAAVTALKAAGYTDAQEKTMLSESVNDYAAWTTTRLDWTFNPFRAIDSGKPVADSTYAPLLEQQWRTALGNRGILANHALNNTLVPQLVPIYAAFKKLGAPLTFQTLSQAQVSDNTTINTGIAYGATQIELWQSTSAGGLAVFPESQLAGWGRALAANAATAGL